MKIFIYSLSLIIASPVFVSALPVAQEPVVHASTKDLGQTELAKRPLEEIHWAPSPPLAAAAPGQMLHRRASATPVRQPPHQGTPQQAQTWRRCDSYVGFRRVVEDPDTEELRAVAAAVYAYIQNFFHNYRVRDAKAFVIGGGNLKTRGVPGARTTPDIDMAIILPQELWHALLSSMASSENFCYNQGNRQGTKHWIWTQGPRKGLAYHLDIIQGQLFFPLGLPSNFLETFPYSPNQATEYLDMPGMVLSKVISVIERRATPHDQNAHQKRKRVNDIWDFALAMQNAHYISPAHFDHLISNTLAGRINRIKLFWQAVRSLNGERLIGEEKIDAHRLFTVWKGLLHKSVLAFPQQAEYYAPLVDERQVLS